MGASDSLHIVIIVIGDRMGVRVTGISTPIGGIEREYTEKATENKLNINPIVPSRKVQVFLSSICGDNGKYDKVRAEIKAAIERTQLAVVYTFESEEASTLTAHEHYSFALERCDVCIFLIDNADGVRSGVQNEIDTAKRNNIKSIFYFCDETKKEMTPLQQSLLGANFAKSKTVHSFEELRNAGAQALVNDIVSIYESYCHGLIIPSVDNTGNDIHVSELGANTNHYVPVMPKEVIGRLGQTKEYILRMIFGYTGSQKREIESSDIDSWAKQFLAIMFEGKSIRDFNTGMFLETLKLSQDETYHEIVEMRWKAVQAYFLGNIDQCVEYLNQALENAKKTQQPTWVIQDILIDLRNQQFQLATTKNSFHESSAQNELDEIGEKVYYPALDRIHESLHEKYIAGLYKQKIESPYSVTFGNDFEEYGALLSSCLVVSLFNGSLTHLLIFYDRLSDFLFYLCSRYDDWRFRRDLLKFAIFKGKDSDVKGIRDAYPEVLNEMSAKDAADIVAFCFNHPVAHKRFRSLLLAFGIVGYYLDEVEYVRRLDQVLSEIKAWINDERRVIESGQYVFKCLTDSSFRISQNDLAEICCLFMEKHLRRWYIDMYKFMANRLDLNKMDNDMAQRLLNDIVEVMNEGNEKSQIEYQSTFLIVFRIQNRALTDTLDEKIKEHFPRFYDGEYKLETAIEAQNVTLSYIHTCLDRIEHSNETQGANGCFFGHGTRDIATIRNLLLRDEANCDESTMDRVVSTVSDTLLKSKEGINEKLDAVSLLICIALKYPIVYGKHKVRYDEVISSSDSIEDIDNTFLSSNIDKMALRIAISLLEIAVGGDAYINLLEDMSYIQSDKATILSVARIVTEYLEIDDSVILPKMVGSVILQNTLQWLQQDNLDIKYCATKILLLLGRNSDNESIVNQRVISLITNENVYIKNLILRRLYKTKCLLESTQQYVISKCMEDSCAVVRMVCKEIQKPKE